MSDYEVKGYVICAWEEGERTALRAANAILDTSVGWMPLRDAHESDESDRTYTGLYEAFARYLSLGYTTEILEVCHYEPDYGGTDGIGRRIAWWERRLKERDDGPA